MRKRAEEVLNRELKIIVTSSEYATVKESLTKLINLADILDSIGDEKDADRIDYIIKEAAGFWDFLLSGMGGAATTKDEGGSSILDALKGGKLGDFFNKDVLVKMLTKFLVGGGIGLLASELVEVITQKVPILNWFGDSKFIKMAIESALTYAVVNSDFVTKLVDGIVNQIEGAIGMKIKQEDPKQSSTPPTPTPTTQESSKSQPTNEGTETQTFQVAAPGAKV